MKTLSTLLWVLVAVSTPFITRAQEIDYPLAIEEDGLMRYMASMAWLNNPANDNFAQEVFIAKEEVKMAKRGWWKNISVSLNVNEANYKRNASGNIFFPKYNFGAAFDLGSVLDTKNKTKITSHKVKIAESTSLQAEKNVKGRIIQLYQEYLTAIEILKLRYRSESDMKTNFKLVERLFEQGDNRVRLPDQNEASFALNNVTESRIKANRNVAISKLKLEDFIGAKLELVESKFKNR